MGRFKKGESGNPSGRPRGIQDKRTALRGLLEPHADDLAQKAVDLALEGDTTALRLCLERICPALRAKDEPVNVDGLNGTLTEQAQRIVKAMGSGVLTPSEAAHMLQALAMLRFRALPNR